VNPVKVTALIAPVMLVQLALFAAKVTACVGIVPGR
jgi:hypothetical protein